MSPSQYKLFKTPVERFGSKLAPTLTVRTFDDKFPHEISSSKIPSASESIQVKATLLKLVVVVKLLGGA